MLDVVDKSDGKRKILSAGRSRFGVLGQGNDVKESEFFKPVQFGDSQILNIELNSRVGFAVAKDGKLYAWGSNEYQQMGLELGKDKTQWTPTLVKFFDGQFNVKDVRCGEQHALVEAKKVKGHKELAESCIYSMGRVSSDTNYCLGLQEAQIKGPNKDKLRPWEI
jgi:alpha-tubulin suppressor-like RCC1 family protein